MPRRAGYRHHEETRQKIKAAMLINRLQDHVEAEKPVLDASQVNAAKALLAKVLPDLSAITMDNVTHRDLTEWTRAELIAVLNDAVNSGAGAAEADGSGGKPDSVH